MSLHSTVYVVTESNDSGFNIISVVTSYTGALKYDGINRKINGPYPLINNTDEKVLNTIEFFNSVKPRESNSITDPYSFKFDFNSDEFDLGLQPMDTTD